MFPYGSGPYPSFIHSSSSSSSSSIPYPPFPFPFLHQLENASSTLNTSILQDPLSIPYIPTPIPETLSSLAVSDHNHSTGVPKHDIPSITTQEKLFGSGHHYGISRFLTKKPPKKDRHSKIYTSQGLRDRRVRLSIEIARKFFDLQDTLGFDKASNTLEWLFSKSKKAIKDLAKSKSNGGGGGATSFSSSSSSECEEENCEVVSGSDKMANNKERSVKEKRALKEPASSARAKMKESREKARARARERTSNKINNNGRVQVQDMMKKKCPLANENSQMLHHQVEECSGGRDRDEFNVIEESIVIKRKLKPNSSMMASSSHHHHQSLGLMIPNKEGSFNNENYHSFPDLSPNLDANGARSNFCAIASMNLSTGLQIFGKSWEECTNPRLH